MITTAAMLRSAETPGTIQVLRPQRPVDETVARRGVRWRILVGVEVILDHGLDDDDILGGMAKVWAMNLP